MISEITVSAYPIREYLRCIQLLHKKEEKSHTISSSGNFDSRAGVDSCLGVKLTFMQPPARG